MWLRKRTGDETDVERFAQQAADAGHPTALRELAELRGAVGCAERLRRFGLEVDGSPAQPWW